MLSQTANFKLEHQCHNVKVARHKQLDPHPEYEKQRVSAYHTCQWFSDALRKYDHMGPLGQYPVPLLFTTTVGTVGMFTDSSLQVVCQELLVLGVQQHGHPIPWPRTCLLHPTALYCHYTLQKPAAGSPMVDRYINSEDIVCFKTHIWS